MLNIFRRNGKRKESKPASSPVTSSPTLEGTKAPDFSLPATKGEHIRLSELRGQPVVLVFYPADDTPVCSAQLALYNEALHLFEAHQAQILGISVDGIASHKAYADSLKLRFPLLADDDPYGEVASRYGVFNEDKGNSERALFVIDSQGIIRWGYISPRSVNPGANGILDALASLEEGSRQTA